MNQDQALTREEIVAMEDVVVEPHLVPQWKNRRVYVRSISALERGDIEASAAKFKESKGKDMSFASTFTVMLAWLGMCDANGNRLFQKKEDVALLQKKNAAAIAGIAEHVQRLSGFSKEDLEELEKNLPEAQQEGSPSA